MIRKVYTSLAVAVVGAVCAGLATPAAAGGRAVGAGDPSAGAAGRVVVVGVPGLRWADLSPHGTPGLWALAARSAVGALSVRSADAVTCPGDGFATVSAGNRARDPRGLPRGGPCPPLPPSLTPPGLAAWTGAARADNRRLSFDAEVGALGDAAERRGCTAASGPGAALAAADRRGSVGVLVGAEPGSAPGGAVSTAAGRCPLVVVQAPPVVGPDRVAGAHAADAVVRAVAATASAGTVLVVVGVSETGDDAAHLHVVMAAGPGFRTGDLVSPTTRRPPYVQLIDVAPTVLRVLGVAAPSSMAGRAMHVAGGPRAAASVADTVRRLADLDVAAQVQHRVVPPFFVALVLGQALLYAVAWVALRRLPTDRARRRVLWVTEVAAVTGAAAVLATYVGNVVPWWHSGHPVATLLAVVAATTALVAALAFAGPWRRCVLGPATLVTATTAAVLVVDLTTGGRLQMSSLAGYSPLAAGRFAGVGNVAFAVLATASLLAVSAVTGALARRAAVVAVAAAGAVVVSVDGAPTWGDDFGGVIALVSGFALLGLLTAGARVTWRRLVGIAVAAVLAVAAFAAGDYARPPDAQTHLGRFVGQLLHGGAGTVIARKADSNLQMLTGSVLTLLVPLAVALLAALLRRPPAGLRRAFEAAPALRHGLVATLAMGVVGALVNDSGVAIPAVAMTVAIPVAVAASARVARRREAAAPAYDGLDVGAHGDAPVTR